MLTGDPHAQDAGPDPEPQRRLEHQRLAVDAGGDRAVGVDLELGRRPLAPRPLRAAAALAAPGRRADDGDPEQPVVDARPRARADRAAEPVAVVGDQDRGARGCSCPPGPVQRRSSPLPSGPSDLGQRVEDRPQLRLAVAVALDRLGVDAERDVVDEDPAVDLGEVDAALAAVDERVERADDVVAVDPEVEREVVAGAGRDAGVGQAVLGGDRGDDRLRAVAAGHRERVGAVGDRVAHELLRGRRRASARSARSRARGPPRRG